MIRYSFIKQIAVLLLSATLLAAASAQDLECPVLSASGGSTDDGSIFLMGQFSAGLISNGSDEIDQGAVPCWTEGTPCVGDLTGDNVIDLSDLAIMLSAFATCPGDPAFNPDADLDGDGCVALNDLVTQLSVFETTCP